MNKRRKQTVTFTDTISKSDIEDHLDFCDLELSADGKSYLEDWDYDIEVDVDEVIDRLEELDYIVVPSDEASREVWRSQFTDDSHNLRRNIAESVANVYHAQNDDKQMLRDILAELTGCPAMTDADTLCERMRQLIY